MSAPKQKPVKKTAEDFNEEGLEAFNKQKYQEALECFIAAAQIEPNQPSYQKNIAETYYRLGDVPKSISHYQRAIWLDHNRADFYNELGLIYMNQSHLRTALTLFQTATSIDPENMVYQENEANILRKIKEYHLALRLYLRLLKKNPQSPKIHNGIGGCYFGIGQYSYAIPYFKRALELDKENWLYRQNLADSYRNNKNYVEAASEYERLLVITPDDHLSWNFLGVSYLELGDLRNAKRCFKRAVELDGTNVNYWINLGNGYRVSGNYKSALMTYQKAKKMVEYNSYLENVIAMAHFHLEQFTEARRIYEKLIKKDPTNLMFHENYVEVLMRMKAFGSAREWIQYVFLPETLDNNPISSSKTSNLLREIHGPLSSKMQKKDLAYNYHLLGICCMNLGKIEDATRYNELALEIEPKNNEYKQNISSHTSTIEVFDVNLKNLKKKIDENPGDPTNYYELGKAELIRDHYLEAYDCFKNALNLGSSSRWVQFYLALCEFALNHYKKALKNLADCLEKDSGNWRAHTLSANCYFQLEDKQNAIFHLNQAQSIWKLLEGYITDVDDFDKEAIQQDLWYLLSQIEEDPVESTLSQEEIDKFTEDLLNSEDLEK